MLNTIRLPNNLSQLPERLPKSKYSPNKKNRNNSRQDEIFIRDESTFSIEIQGLKGQKGRKNKKLGAEEKNYKK